MCLRAAVMTSDSAIFPDFAYVFVGAVAGSEVYSATLAASLLSIVVNAFLVRSLASWVARHEHPA